MDEPGIDKRLLELERRLTVQRFTVIALLLISSAVWLMAAKEKEGEKSAKFGKVTCQRLEIVGKDGKPGLVAGSEKDQVFQMNILGPDSKSRIKFVTGPTFSAYLMTDADGKQRVKAYIDESSNDAVCMLLDRNGKPRVSAATMGDGQVIMPVMDLKGRQLPGQ